MGGIKRNENCWGKTAIVVVSVDHPRECNGEADTSFKLGREVITPVKEVGILGVTIESQLTFASHAQNMRNNLTRRKSVLNALSGKNWGPTSNDLRRLYNTYAKPGGLYASEVWAPFLSESNWKKLETCNNRASRITTGTPSCTPSAASRLDARTPSLRLLVEDNAALLWERYRRFPESHHLNKLCKAITKPRLRSRGENSFRPDWRRTAMLGIESLNENLDPIEQIWMGCNESAREEYFRQMPEDSMHRKATNGRPLERSVNRKGKKTY